MKKMYKKGEIGTTLTWIVATIAILVIIIIFLIAAGLFDPLKFLSTQKQIRALAFPEQQESLFAISRTPEIKEALFNEDYKNVETKLSPILEKIGLGRTYEDSLTGFIMILWNFEIYKNDKLVHDIFAKHSKGPARQQSFDFFYSGPEKFQLRMYLVCDGLENFVQTKNFECYDDFSDLK